VLLFFFAGDGGAGGRQYNFTGSKETAMKRAALYEDTSIVHEPDELIVT